MNKLDRAKTMKAVKVRRPIRPVRAWASVNKGTNRIRHVYNCLKKPEIIVPPDAIVVRVEIRELTAKVKRGN